MDKIRVDLSVMERVQILNFLPPQGNIVTMKIVAELRTELGFSEKELEDWSIMADNDRLSWDADKSKDKTIEIGVTALGILKDTVKTLDEKGEVTAAMLGVIEKLGL